MARLKPIPVIDLFAGPGGLSEGFSSLLTESGERRFDVRVSIEKDAAAQKTLMLRALFRTFSKGKVPDCYYDYVRGDIKRDVFYAHPDIKEAAEHAGEEARQAELGTTPSATTDGWIAKALTGASDWALIGGPPCQAYSLAGRARMTGVADFAEDKRHFLYQEYLRIIKKFKPTVFVMENVKGMLTSQHGGSLIFERILADLKEPGKGLSYRIQSLVVKGEDLDPHDFIIESEKFGIPQRRHRVILFGIRSDVVAQTPALREKPNRFILTPSSKQVSVAVALGGLPKLRSKLSGKDDSSAAWRAALKNAPEQLKRWDHPLRSEFEKAMRTAYKKSAGFESSGAEWTAMDVDYGISMPRTLLSWYRDDKLGGVLQHSSRGHMEADLHRYMFAAIFARRKGLSPKLPAYPPKLLPDHANVTADSVPFIDRFRVQLATKPSTTVVSHIAKDGHYYIHPDPAQCRSFTAREAARLQTFPDNYFFEGGRTQQFHQIGNAVPPLLARRIANIVSDFLWASKR